MPYFKRTFTSTHIVHLHNTLEKKVRLHFIGEEAEAQRGGLAAQNHTHTGKAEFSLLPPAASLPAVLQYLFSTIVKALKLRGYIIRKNCICGYLSIIPLF